MRVTLSSTFLLRSLSLVAVVAASVALTGCGRKGDPEIPVAPKATEARPVGIPIGTLPVEPRKASETAPKKSFILDPLL